MLPIYSYNLILAAVCAFGYYKAGEIENTSSWFWAGLSFAISIFVWQVLHWGLLGMLFGQLILLAGITMWRVIRDSKN